MMQGESNYVFQQGLQCIRGWRNFGVFSMEHGTLYMVAPTTYCLIRAWLVVKEEVLGLVKFGIYWKGIGLLGSDFTVTSLVWCFLSDFSVKSGIRKIQASRCVTHHDGIWWMWFYPRKYCKSKRSWERCCSIIHGFGGPFSGLARNQRWMKTGCWLEFWWDFVGTSAFAGGCVLGTWARHYGYGIIIGHMLDAELGWLFFVYLCSWIATGTWSALGFRWNLAATGTWTEAFKDVNHPQKRNSEQLLARIWVGVLRDLDTGWICVYTGNEPGTMDMHRQAEYVLLGVLLLDW